MKVKIVQATSLTGNTEEITNMPQRRKVVEDNFWPTPLEEMASEEPFQGEYVSVAEISRPWGSKSHRHIYTALIPPPLKDKVLSSAGGIGHEVTTTGPHPSPFKGSYDYLPKFSIWAGENAPEGLEPLVVAWSSGNKTVMLPDQGFLMTYGLIPRTVKSDDGDMIYWDDPQKPRFDVVIAKMSSEYFFELKSEAYIKIASDYLQDYATVRNHCLAQVYYACNTSEFAEKDREALGQSDMEEIILPGRTLDLRKDPRDRRKLFAQVWGIREIVSPHSSPVLGGRWDYGSLSWPGIKEPVNDAVARKLSCEYVYVNDSVLEYYEDNPDKFSIHPESGSVSYKGQWSVSYCDRVGRDVIKLEIRKLYEGCPPHVVEHWHKFAIAPPIGDIAKLSAEPNCASRTKSIVDAFCKLGESLSNISQSLPIADFVGLDPVHLDYHGWWEVPAIASIARHIPLGIGERAFLDRCKDLNSLLVEGMNESNIRRLLISFGMDRAKIKTFRTLKLLDTLLQLAYICIETGLDIHDNFAEVDEIWTEKISKLKPGEHLSTPFSTFFTLNDLRNAAAHPGKKIKEFLEVLGTDTQSVRTGYGHVLDKLYEAIASALTDATRDLNVLLKSSQ